MKRSIKLNARETLTATLKIQRIGNQPGRFSLTGEIRDSRRRRDGGVVACGCLHDEILKAWPDLVDAAALHLSDAETGEPMHAAANGWYWYAGAVVEAGFEKPQGAGRYIGEATQGRTCAAIFAKHCRIGDSYANELIQQQMSGPQFHEWIGTQRERWQGEAESIKQRYELS